MKNSKDYYSNIVGQTTASQMAELIFWEAANKLRGFLSANEYPPYILSFFFFKYISDLWKDSLLEKNNNELKQGNNLPICRFIIPKDTDFDTVRKLSLHPEFVNYFHVALREIELANKDKFEGIFSSIGYDAAMSFKDRNSYVSILHSLLDFFSDFNFQPSVESNDTIAQCFELLLEKISWFEGKKGGYTNTPYEVSALLKLLLEPQEQDTIYDPACGYGGSLVHFGNCQNKGVRLHGQEVNQETYNIARMNMFIHCFDDANIQLGDSINDPKFIAQNNLSQFDIVVSTPPFSISHWWRNGLDYRMFKWGMPPENKGDYAFISHMLTASTNQKGRIGILVSHGTLVRKGQEQEIRKGIIEDNLLEAVIGLPANLLTATTIPVAVLLFNKNRGDNQNILFINASNEFYQNRRKNILSSEGIERIVSTYNAFKQDPSKNSLAVVNGFSSVVSLEEIAQNEFNINLERYVHIKDEKQPVDIEKLASEISLLDIKLKELRTKILNNLSL
ncbi:N-6 DNA methylase [Niastella sp. OAS944]|uniref:N-6 DNA methylase n=1 Tax=Niastella sp. OAS944 TaxID=2664089 RepID=UPI00347FDA67|nr:type I restriction enzyme M protein [Chitinophagaceae bacterium OAS944]